MVVGNSRVDRSGLRSTRNGGGKRREGGSDGPRTRTGPLVRVRPQRHRLVLSCAEPTTRKGERDWVEGGWVAETET